MEIITYKTDFEAKPFDINGYLTELEEKVDYYFPFMIKYCKENNTKALAYIFKNINTVAAPNYGIHHGDILFGIACENNNYKCMKIIGYVDPVLWGENYFYMYYKKSNLNVMKGIIILSIKHKRAIQVRFEEKWRGKNLFRNSLDNYDEIKDTHIINYLTCCGAGSDDSKIII